jgi:hypothetical protein
MKQSFKHGISIEKWQKWYESFSEWSLAFFSKGLWRWVKESFLLQSDIWYLLPIKQLGESLLQLQKQPELEGLLKWVSRTNNFFKLATAIWTIRNALKSFNKKVTEKKDYKTLKFEFDIRILNWRLIGNLVLLMFMEKWCVRKR